VLAPDHRLCRRCRSQTRASWRRTTRARPRPCSSRSRLPGPANRRSAKGSQAAWPVDGDAGPATSAPCIGPGHPRPRKASFRGTKIRPR
jgi:hypothetical protein